MTAVALTLGSLLGGVTIPRVLAGHTADDVTIPIVAAWGGSGTAVQVTYQIKASGAVPQDVVDTVQDAIGNWNAAIDEREAGWDFDLVPFVGSKPAKANIVINVKKGGGAVQGLALAKSDRVTGLITSCQVTVSGAFAFIVDLNQVLITAWQELGHCLGLGHADQPEDPMCSGSAGGEACANEVPTDNTVWHCDADAFVSGHHWLTASPNVANTAHHPSTVGITEETCAGSG